MKRFVFLPFALFATVNTPPRLEWLTGYRNDTIHWHSTAGYDVRYRGMQFWENGLALQGIHRDIAYYAAGGYGAFGKGYPDTKAYALDGGGYLGYAVNLTPDRTYRAILLPLVGFSGHYEDVYAPKFYTQTWYGPFVGGGLQIEPGGPMAFRVGYAYHWLHLRVHTPPVRLSGWEANRGHSGWARVDGGVGPFWRFGLEGEIFYYFSSNLPVDGAIFKLRWFSISGLVTISRSL